MAQITPIYALRRLQQQTNQNVAAAGLLAGLCFNEGPDQWLFFLRHFGIPRLSGSVRYGRSRVKPKSLTPFASTFLMSSIAGFMWWDYLDDDDRVTLRLATAMTVAVHFYIYWTLSGRKKE